MFLNDSEILFDRVEKVKIENDKGIELYKQLFQKNGKNKIIYSIIETEDQIEVILPINENLELFQFSERVARLFFILSFNRFRRFWLKLRHKL
ncbi:hypothetical protein [Sphingobacterium spiritivorum]|uniref:hypothetical protein n=1 Tax=Sphingobacterium spiritivorum TaxID=258 RepID=UPI000E0EC49D|nr:hypothetical protein [Sphingobacterium spiritivorum]